MRTEPISNPWSIIIRSGRELVEGPHAIHPPEPIDDFGWLECYFRLGIYKSSDGGPETIAIYTDDTMNRVEGFLPPMIRHAIWPTRAADLKAGASGKLQWPGVVISLGLLGDKAGRVDEIIRKLHRHATNLPFVPTGLSVARDVPEIDADWEKGRISLLVGNGYQSVEFGSQAMAADNGFTEAFFEAFAELRTFVEPISPLDGWSEYYHNRLMSDEQKGWYWDYSRDTE